MKWTIALLAALTLAAQPAADLKAPVEILRDKWGVPHIYAQNADDLFFAQGWIAAKDRLFQIDLWRRVGTGKLAEVLGPQAVPRDRIARLVRYRGDWDQEWQSYSPDTKAIVTAFVNGINAYIKSLGNKRPLEFRIAGYDPGFWAPEDVVSRIAGLLMTRNAQSEVSRALAVARFGAEQVERLQPPDPFIKLVAPKGLDLSAITNDILKDYTAAIGTVRFPGEQGSNNWVVDSSMTTTGMPLLANDPHRPIQLPSLRKTVHLVAPGWNVIGAGEPSLPGVALGHNQEIAYGFTIVGIDQQDLYVERVNPNNPAEYMSKGKWTAFKIERESINVKGQSPQTVELKFTAHGPVLYENKGFAYALKWVGEGPGGAGYLAALRLARARNWREFQTGAKSFNVPSENLNYADRGGNIGWIAAGLAPIRGKGHTGLFPVPGDTGEYEWAGFLPLEKHPQVFNPPQHYIATANHKIIPPGYAEQLSYEWSAPSRFNRIEQMLKQQPKFSIEDFERMQQDVVSLPARRFQKILSGWKPAQNQDAVRLVREWDARVTADSKAALIFELWMSALPQFLWPAGRGSGVVAPNIVLDAVELHSEVLGPSLELALSASTKISPGDPDKRVWGALHQLSLRHPLNAKRLDLAPIARPGDSNTVNAASGANHSQTNGPSYRQIIDLSNWDNSVMTNVPGESGDPESKHYSDLLADWAAGRYHPMPFSRAAVEAAMEERILLEPGKVSKP